MPEGAELQIKTGQRGLLIASYKRVEKRLMGHGFCRAGSPYNCTLGTARVPVSEEVLPPAHSTLSAAELPQAKKKKKPCVYAQRFTSVMSISLQPCRLWLARLLYWGVLQARILKCIGQYWLPYPSRALYFLLP